MSKQLKIEKPDFISDMHTSFTCCFLDWWHDQVEPINHILNEGVEVSGNVDQFSMSSWRATKWRGPETDTHKALLINIEPIKKETREEKLEKLVREVMQEKGWISSELIEKAAAVLGE